MVTKLRFSFAFFELHLLSALRIHILHGFWFISMIIFHLRISYFILLTHYHNHPHYHHYNSFHSEVHEIHLQDFFS